MESPRWSTRVLACITVFCGGCLFLAANDRVTASGQAALARLQATAAAAAVLRSSSPSSSSSSSPPSSSSSSLPSSLLPQSSAALDRWAVLPQGYDDDTLATLRRLEEYQNPPDCENQKYFLWQIRNAGMGSDIHTIGIGMAFAMERGRILLYHWNSTWIYTSADVCGDMLTPDCYFRPLSRCQYMADTLAARESVLYDKDSTAWQDAQFVHWDDFFAHWGTHVPGTAPNVSDWGSRGTAWWRANTARFVIQPKPMVYDFVKSYFADHLMRYPPTKPKWSARREPPPNNAICMHIRHGDKSIEMRTHPSVEYMEAARGIVRRDPSVTRSIFFSTDNQTVLDEIEHGVFDQYNFTFYYTRYERRGDDMSPMDLASTIGGGRFGSISLANLMLGAHPNCKAFVQTTGSNWNRLIDEVRKTDGLRQGAVFVDLEPGEW